MSVLFLFLEQWEEFITDPGWQCVEGDDRILWPVRSAGDATGWKSTRSEEPGRTTTERNDGAQEQPTANINHQGTEGSKVSIIIWTYYQYYYHRSWRLGECINGSPIPPESSSGYLILVVGSLTWLPRNLRLSLKFLWIFQCWLPGLAFGLPDYAIVAQPGHQRKILNSCTETSCLTSVSVGFIPMN